MNTFFCVSSYSRPSGAAFLVERKSHLWSLNTFVKESWEADFYNKDTIFEVKMQIKCVFLPKKLVSIRKIIQIVIHNCTKLTSRKIKFASLWHKMKRFHLSVGLFDILKWEMFLLLQAIPRDEMQWKTRNTSGVVLEWDLLDQFHVCWYQSWRVVLIMQEKFFRNILSKVWKIKCED